jgi:hypothetical protein
MEASSLYNLTSNSYMVIVHILFIQKQYSLIVSVHLDDHIIELHLKLLSQTELYNFNPPPHAMGLNSDDLKFSSQVRDTYFCKNIKTSA